MVVFWEPMDSTNITGYMNYKRWLVFEYCHCIHGYIAVLRREQCQIGHLWNPVDHGQTMAVGRFLRSHDLNWYHLQYRCFGLFYIWAPPLYNRVYLCSVTWALPSWGVSVNPRMRRHDGWWSFSKRPWPKLISCAIWMHKDASNLNHVVVYSGISRSRNVNITKLGYVWNPRDCCGTIADGRFS